MPSEIRNHVPLSSPRNEPPQNAVDRLAPGGAVTSAASPLGAAPGPSARSRRSALGADPRQGTHTFRAVAVRDAIPPEAVKAVLALRDCTIVNANEALFPKCAQAQKAYMGSIVLAEEFLSGTSGLRVLSKQVYFDSPDHPFLFPGMSEATAVLGLIATKWSVQITNHMEKNGIRNDDGRKVQRVTVSEDFHRSFPAEKDALLAEVDAHFSEWLTLHSRRQRRPENAPPMKISRETAIKSFYADTAPAHGSEAEEWPSQFIQAKKIIRAALFDVPTDANGQVVDNDDYLPPHEERLATCAAALTPYAARMVIGRQISQEVLRAVTPLQEIAARALQRSQRQTDSGPGIPGPADKLILRTAVLNPRIIFSPDAAFSA